MEISVIIPAFNCANFVRNAVESVFQSRLGVSEIIIVNDGSEDGTGDAARMLSSRHREIRVIDQENTGVSAARNRGVREARGEYLLFLDADDSLVPGSLAEIDQILEAEDPDMLLFGMCFDYYYRSRCYRSDEKVYPKSGAMSKEEWNEELNGLYRANMLSPIWNKLIRRDLIVKNDISFREDMIEMEDYLFSMDCLARCEKIYVLDKAAYRYRQPENERGTFNRLWRIQSLSAYVRPFYDIAPRFESKAAVVTGIADQIYSVLFREQIRFASLKQIRDAADDMLSGEYRQAIEQRNKKLYHDLESRKYLRVWLQRLARRLRHRAAVYVKYRRSRKNSV